MMMSWRLACSVVALLLLQGCASLRGPDPSDPLEPLNRKVTAFNDVADDLVLRPVAVFYGQILPTVPSFMASLGITVLIPKFSVMP